MSTGGSNSGSSRSVGPRRPPLGEFVDFGDGRTPLPHLPTDDQPTVISPKGGSSGPMPILTGQEWAEALVGQSLGHYELLEIVGAGGMGSVYRGHDTALDKTVAVKVLLPSSADDEDLLRRFKNEAQSAARLDHVHAARVYYVGEERGLHYIVYEYIEGRNIRDLVIESGPLPIADALRYTYQIADALAHAATRDVVHRDIKPSNVLVTDEGIAKLVDMGLARLHQVEHSGGDLTASGVTLGTFDFISPEQARDPRRADVRSDIYSLGCTLYFMLTGQPPFPSGTVLQKLLQHEGDVPPDPRLLRADCADDLAEIVRTMLAKKPEHRYQTPAVLMSELAGFAHRAALGPLGAAGTAIVVPRRRRDIRTRKHAPWVLAVAAFALVVVFVDAMSRSDDAASMFLPFPDAPPSDNGPAEENDANRTGRKNASLAGADATPAGRSDKADINNSRENRTDDNGQSAPTDKPKNGAVSPQQVGPDADPIDIAAASTAPGVSVGAPNPVRAEFDTATRAATRSATPNDAAATASAPSLSASIGAGGIRERVGPESASANRTTPERTAADAATATAATATAAIATVESPGVVTVVVGDATVDGATVDGATVGGATVDGATGDGRAFASLGAALDAAHARLQAAAARGDGATSGDAIHSNDWLIRVELRFDGPLACDPLRIEGAKVDIFAADGFSPLLVFRPTALAASSDLPSAITIAEGELTIEHVALELRRPSGLTARARLFEAQEADLIRLRDCSLTISADAAASGISTSGDSRSKGAFFDVTASRVAAAARMAPDMPEMNGAMPLLTIRLDRCVVRGDADLVRVGGARNARLTWSNGLAVLGGSLLSIDGSRHALPGAHVRAMLNHLTVGLRGNVASIANTQTAPFLPVVEVESYDGIFVGADQPLIASQGVDSIEDFRDRFRWKGERNFYDNWTRMWRIHGVGFESEPEEMGFRDWVSHWGRAESAPSLGPVIWRNPISLARPPHEQQLADFALADADANPARGSGEKGTNAGAALDQLPALPWPGPLADGAVR
ncbi:MAG: protein kinase [Pirellulales bacterium]